MPRIAFNVSNIFNLHYHLLFKQSISSLFYRFKSNGFEANTILQLITFTESFLYFWTPKTSVNFIINTSFFSPYFWASFSENINSIQNEQAFLRFNVMAEIQDILCKSQLNLQDSMKLIAQKEASLTTFLMYYQCATFQEVLAPQVGYYKSKGRIWCLKSVCFVANNDTENSIIQWK